MNFGMNESAQCAAEKRETAKELLESMGVILEAMRNEVRMIADAVYRGCTPVEEVPNEPKATPPMIVIMQGQRDAAGEILRELERIREALW